MRKSMIALGAAAMAAGLFLGPFVTTADAQRGPVRYHDSRGGDRGFAFCLKQGLEIFDCSYFTWAQCQASASARPVECVLNPFAAEQGQRAYQPRKVKRKKARRAHRH